METLRPAIADEVSLGASVEEKFVELCQAHIRIKGMSLLVPDSLMSDMKAWRQMVMRHRKGDFRCNDSEVKATRSFAQWTLDINALLRGQPKPKPLEWRN